MPEGVDTQAASQILMVLLTFVYVVGTLLLVRAGNKTVLQMQEQTWAANRALIVSRLSLHGQLLWLVVSNEGRSAATYVRLTLSQEILKLGHEDSKLTEAGLFSRVIQTIPPKMNYYFLLAPGWIKPGTQGLPSDFEISATYETDGRKVAETTHLDVGILEGQDFPPRDADEHLKKIASLLEKIERSIARLK